MISKVTEADINIFRQSKSSLYSLLDNQKYESTSLPINANTLNFLDKGIDLLFIKEQFLNKSHNNISSDFRTVLTFYYIISSILFLSLLSFSILLFSSNKYSNIEFVIHLVLPFFFLCSNFFILFLLNKRMMYVLISKNIYTSFAILVNTFLILCDDKILSTFLKIENSTSYLPYSLALLTFSFLTRSIIFDDYFHYFITVIHSIVLFLVCNLAFSQADLYSKLCECSVVCLFLVYQLVEVHMNSFRCKVIFWRKYNEEQAVFANNDSEKSNIKDFQTETEHLIHMCEKVKSDVKYAVKAIMFKDIKDKLRETLLCIQRIKRIVGHGVAEKGAIIESHVKDLEDREFIQQNFRDMITATDYSRTYTIVSFLEQRNNNFVHKYELEELAGVMESVGKNWSFDIWFVFETTGKNISILGRYLFDKYDLASRYRLSSDTIDGYFSSLESSYLDSPYHNSCHAADVTHSLMYFYINSDIYKFLNPVDTMASIIAALGHDVAHPGVNARYLIMARDSLSIQYNDSSILENMHCSKIFFLMTKPGHNLFERLDSEDWSMSRKIIIEMVLSTDMAKHFEILGRFRTRSAILNDINLDKLEDKLLVFSAALKSADLGHSAKYTDLHQRWTKLLMEEFFKQGDLEKAKGFQVSTYCDRSNTNIGKSQAGFLRNVCLPLYDVWVKYLNSQTANRVLEELKKNIDFWDTVQKSRRSTQPIMSDTVKLSSL